MNNLSRLAELVKARDTSTTKQSIGSLRRTAQPSVSFRLKEEPVNLEGHKRFVKKEGMQVPVLPQEFILAND